MLDALLRPDSIGTAEDKLDASYKTKTSIEYRASSIEYRESRVHSSLLSKKVSYAFSIRHR